MWGPLLDCFHKHECQYLISSLQHLPVGYLSSLSVDQCVYAIIVHLLLVQYMKEDLFFQPHYQDANLPLIGNFKLCNTLCPTHNSLALLC